MRLTLINRTVSSLSKLPNDKVQEVSNFTEFILKKYEDEILQKGIHKLVGNSDAFQFLKDEEDLYSDTINKNAK